MQFRHLQFRLLLPSPLRARRQDLARRLRPLLAAAIVASISTLVTASLRRKRPNSTSPAREPPSLRRQAGLLLNERRKKIAPPFFEPFVAEGPQFQMPGHCPLPIDSLCAGRRPKPPPATENLCARGSREGGGNTPDELLIRIV